MLLTRSDDLIDPFFHPATTNRFAGPLAAAIIDDLCPMLLQIRYQGRQLLRVFGLHFPSEVCQGSVRATVPQVVQQVRDVDRFLLLIARHHTHQLSHLFVQVVPIQDQRHRLIKQLCQLAANRSGAIRDRDDRQRLSPASIVLLELPPYPCCPRDHLLAHRIDPRREIGEAPCRLFHQPDLSVHTLRLALHCGLVRPLPPIRFLLSDLNCIRQEQDFLTLWVIPVHLRRHHWQGRGSRFSLTLALPLPTDLHRFGHHQVLNRLVTEHSLPRDALQEPCHLVVAHP